ncbi:hypothetical protein HPB49_016018 [Dermacentor silvarum]|uniref:Uncharacterized protein n=1 Tax=Dermacentor silvarum TaxID=543639 RepID=A0ACB8CY51_DERSI|nr:hypothetical protein HPB49_016018 [Dermacentor silvarum]
MYRPSQTPRLTLSSEQVAQARPVPPRRETGGPSLGARSVDNSMVRFPLHRTDPPLLPSDGPHTTAAVRTTGAGKSEVASPSTQTDACMVWPVGLCATAASITSGRSRRWSGLGRTCFLRRRASPSPGAVPFLLLDPSPTGSALRANPFPKVTDPFCRLPLPTLVYRLEAVHLGDLLRMWVRSGTKITLPHSDFQGPTGAHRTAQEPHCSTEPPSLSRGEPIPGTRSPYREKKTLPGAPIGVSELVCVAALGPEGPISVAGFGTVNPIPFWLQRGVSDSQTELHKRARF